MLIFILFYFIMFILFDKAYGTTEESAFIYCALHKKTGKDRIKLEAVGHKSSLFFCCFFLEEKGERRGVNSSPIFLIFLK